MTGKSGDEADALLECYFAVQGYLRISKLYDDRFVTYAEMSQSEVFLKLFCLDPLICFSRREKLPLQRIFSATLMPLGYYRDMLGAEEEDYSLSIPSPSLPSNWMFEFYRYRRASRIGSATARPSSGC